MCDPVTAGLILTAVGGGTKAINQGISLRRQDKAAAGGIREQAALQRGADVTVNEQIADIAASTGEQERGESLAGFLNTLRGSSELTGAAADPLALGGQRFAERVEGGEARTRRAGTARAGRLSTIDAAGRQRINEANRVALTATQLEEVQNQSRAADFITRLRVASKRPNPLIDALGSTLQGAGSVVALRPPGGADLGKLFSQGTLIDNPVIPRVPGGIFAPPPIVNV